MNLLTFGLAALLGAAPAFIIVGALTIVVTRNMQLDPQPFIISEIMVANSAGLSTVIGSFVNILIAARYQLAPEHFLTYEGFIILGLPIGVLLGLPIGVLLGLPIGVLLGLPIGMLNGIMTNGMIVANEASQFMTFIDNKEGVKSFFVELKRIKSFPFLRSEIHLWNPFLVSYKLRRRDGFTYF